MGLSDVLKAPGFSCGEVSSKILLEGECRVDNIYLNAIKYNETNGRNMVWANLEASGDSISPRNPITLDLRIEGDDMESAKLSLLLDFLQSTKISEHVDMCIYMGSDSLVSQWEKARSGRLEDIPNVQKWTELLEHCKASYVRRPSIMAQSALSEIILEEMRYESPNL